MTFFVEEEVAEIIQRDITFCSLCIIEEVLPGWSVHVPSGAAWRFDRCDVTLEPGDQVIIDLAGNVADMLPTYRYMLLMLRGPCQH